MKNVARFLVMMLVCSDLLGQQRPAPAQTDTAEKPAPAPREPPKDQISTTQHSITVNGQEISYTARELVLRLVHARRHGCRAPAGHLHVQRRPGLLIGVAAHGSSGAEARRVSR